MAVKTMSLRIPADKAAELSAISRTDDRPVSQTIIEAIDHLIDERRQDKDFQARLKQRMVEDKAVLDRLAQ